MYERKLQHVAYYDHYNIQCYHWKQLRRAIFSACCISLQRPKTKRFFAADTRIIQAHLGVFLSTV